MNPSNQSLPNRPVPDPNKRPSIRESLRVLQTPLRFLKGVGPKRAEELEKFGLKSVEDLLYHLPFRYEDRRQIKTICDATIGGDETFVGEIRGLQKKYNPRRRAQLLVGSLIDDTGSLGLLWYRAPAYLSNSLAQGQRLLVHGKVEPGLNGQKRIVHPEFEVLEGDGEEPLQKILPVYSSPRRSIVVFASKLGKPSAVPVCTFSAELLAGADQTTPRSYCFGRSIGATARARHDGRPRRVEQFLFSCASLGGLRRAFLSATRFGSEEAGAQAGRGRTFQTCAPKAGGQDERAIAV